MATMAQAIRLALHYAEENLGVTDVFGEDVGPPLGGVFTCSQGLKTAWNSPLDERGIIGCAMGLAMAGQRPVAEIQFVDYIFNTIDLLKVAGSLHWASHGDWNLPMVVRTPAGSGIRGSMYHSHSFDTMATHLPGWKVVMPSTPLDAYGLLLAAVQEENPVLYLEPKALLRLRGGERIPGEPDDDRKLSKMIDAPLGDRSAWKPNWPKLEPFVVPIGQAKCTREGTDLTVVCYGRMAPLCLKAAEQVAAEGISAEVIDLRTLIPYDWECVKASIAKTGRVLFVNEDSDLTNFGEHLVRRTVDELFFQLVAAPKLLAAKHVPGIGLADALEMATVPQLPNVVAAIRTLAAEQP
ncbi:MAG: alpha-ketoacid dehydrogenase subunit beta [Myxococcaceae bacterium]